MKNKKTEIIPFHLFKTKNNRYCYISSTNRIYSINKNLFMLLKEIAGIPEKNQIDENQKRALSSVKLNFPLIFGKLVKKLAIPNNLSKSISENTDQIKQLTIELTENCNMSCEYCYYSGQYDLRRTRSDNTIGWDLCKISCDFFMKHSKKLIILPSAFTAENHFFGLI